MCLCSYVVCMYVYIYRATEQAAAKAQVEEKQRHEAKSTILKEVQNWARGKEVWTMLNEVRGRYTYT